MKMRTYKYILGQYSLAFALLLLAGHTFGQRINPATRIQKAPAPDYILLSDDSSEYRHARLDTTLAGGSVVVDTFRYSNDTLYISLSGDGEPQKWVVITGAAIDDQAIDTFSISGNILSISLENDGEPAQTIDLSPYLDNTDNQAVDTFSIAGTILTLALEGDGEAPYTVDLAGIDTDTDNQTVDTFSYHFGTITLALEGDNEAPYTLDVSQLLDNTDDQTLFLSGSSLSIEDGNSVDLSQLLDNTDNQSVDTFLISNDTLYFALENDGQPPHFVIIPPGIDSLNQLLDVEAAPTAGQVLQWNGSLWVAGTVTSGGDADSDPGNEIQTLSYNAATDEISLSLGGGTIDITEVDTDRQTVDSFLLQGNTLILALERDGEAPYTVDLSGLGGGGGSDNQTVDTFTIASNILTLALERDAEDPYTVDLSPYLDNTDGQTLSLVTNTLSISGGNSVDLSPYLDNTDGQAIDTFALVGNTLQISLESDGVPAETVDLSIYADNTDDQVLELTGTELTIEDGNAVDLAGIDTDKQTVDSFLISSNTLILALERDAEAPYTVNLAPYLDNTDAQTLGLVTNTLSITGGNSVDLSPYLDNTDAQTLSLAGNSLSISNGNSVNLSAINTDAQTLTYTGLGALSITGGNSVDLSDLLDNTDAQTLSLSGTLLSISNGNSVNLSGIDTDDQTLTYSGAGALSIAGGNSVDLSDLLDNTDSQQLVLSGNSLSITGGNSVSLVPYLDNTDDQKIDTFALVGNELQISLESDGEPYKAVDLSSLTDDDWRFVSGSTVGDPIWRNGRVNIATQANTHGFRADTSFQFNVYGNTATLDWQDGTAISQSPGLIWSAAGAVDGTNNPAFGGKNNLLLQSNNGTAVGHSLGIIGFGAENPNYAGHHKTSAAIKALADKAWTTGGTGSIMEFYVTGAADTSMHLVATFQTTGRMQLDQYHLIDDGLPTYLLGHNNDSRQVERHPVGGTPDNGDVLKIVSGNLEWAADGGAASVVDLNLLRDTLTRTAHGFNSADCPVPVSIQRNTGSLAAADATTLTNLHSAFVIEVVDANTVVVATQGIFVAPSYHGRHIGRDYFLTDTQLQYDTLSADTIINDWIWTVLDSTRLLLRAARPYNPADTLVSQGFFVGGDDGAHDFIPNADTLTVLGEGISTAILADTLRLTLDIGELTTETPTTADWLAWEDEGTGALRKVTIANLPVSGSGDGWGSDVANTNATLSGNGTVGSPLGIAQQAATPGQVLKWNGSSWAPAADTDTNTDAQTLSFTSPNLSISGGNSVDISAINTDAQTLSLVTNTLSISGGNGVSLAAYLDNTDAQTLSITEATRALDISGGNSIDLSEAIQEEVNDLLVDGSGILITYNDGANTLTIANTGDTDASDDLTTATAFSGDVSGAYNSTVVADDSHNHAAGTITTDIVSSIDGVTNDGGNIDLVAGSGITITPDDGANTITIAATGGGGGDWTIDADAGDTEAISTQTVLFAGAGIASTSYNAAANTLTITATEVDGSTSNELQTLSYNAGTDEITLSNGGGTIDITEVNTDAQTLSLSGTSLSITGGNSADLEYFEADAMDGQTSGTVNLGSEKQYARIIDMTGLSNITITLSNPLDGGAYILLFTNADDGDTVTWPGSVKYETNAAVGTGILSDGRRMVQLLYDGTSFWVPGGY